VLREENKQTVKQKKGMAMNRRRDVVFVNKAGLTCLGVGPHRGKPVRKVPDGYIEWALGELPYASLLRQVLEAEEIRRRIDGNDVKQMAPAKTKLAGDDAVTQKRRKHKSVKQEPKNKPNPPKQKTLDEYADAKESLTRSTPKVLDSGEECPFA
jgi:hypothetical protein